VESIHRPALAFLDVVHDLQSYQKVNDNPGMDVIFVTQECIDE